MKIAFLVVVTLVLFYSQLTLAETQDWSGSLMNN
jgi:hypothetical protein